MANEELAKKLASGLMIHIKENMKKIMAEIPEKFSESAQKIIESEARYVEINKELINLLKEIQDDEAEKMLNGAPENVLKKLK